MPCPPAAVPLTAPGSDTDTHPPDPDPRAGRPPWGRVWECVVGPEETERYQAYFNVSSLRNTQKGVRLRIVSDECPMEGARPADPDLEDVYLYYFREQ